MTKVVNGHCEERYAGVRDAFAAQFSAGRELGGAVAVVVGGELVVDLWAGVADHRTGRLWERDTPCLTFSCVKAVTATCVLMLAERGALDLDAPVAAYWPEFAAAGKERITVRQVLSHQAGLPAVTEPVSLEQGNDSVAMAARLAAQPPLWTPGEAHGYHALTFGWLLSEIVRRVSGQSIGAFIAEQIAGPMGLDLWVGAPEPVADRVARLASRFPDDRASVPVGAPRAPVTGLAAALADPQSLTHTALLNPPLLSGPAAFNRRDVLTAQWPATGGVTTASSLATFYARLLDSRLLSGATLSAALEPQSRGRDRVLLMESAFGLGFMLPSEVFPVPGPAAFGHSGAGGAFGMADPALDMSLAYVTNRLGSGVSPDSRSTELVAALYRCAAAPAGVSSS
jgi:CubicO group peptidase (beta-lactamase class C family)